MSVIVHGRSKWRSFVLSLPPDKLQELFGSENYEFIPNSKYGEMMSKIYEAVMADASYDEILAIRKKYMKELQ